MRTGGTSTTCDQPAIAPGPSEPGVCRPVLRLSALELRPLDSAVTSARLHARAVLTAWGLAGVAGDAELVVSELVTNAVRAAVADAAAGEPFPVRLRLSAHTDLAGVPRAVQAEVWDASGELPRRRPGAPLDEAGGRGLLIVEAVSSRWGCYRAEAGGKVVWAVIGQ